MMVVRKNVLEYIITLVVVKNKVQLKKCLKQFQIWQSSIFRINLSITSLRLIPKFRPVFENQLEKIWFFGVKSWFFTRNTPNIFAPPSARRNSFNSAPLTWNPGSAPDIDLNMYIINVIADDESKIGLYEIYFFKLITKNYNLNVK